MWSNYNHLLWLFLINYVSPQFFMNPGNFNYPWSFMIPFTNLHCLSTIQGEINFNVFMLWPMHQFWAIHVWFSNDSVTRRSSGSVFDIIYTTVSFKLYTDPTLIPDGFSLLQLLITKTITLSMTFIDMLLPCPFGTVFGIHRLEGLLLS